MIEKIINWCDECLTLVCSVVDKVVNKLTHRLNYQVKPKGEKR